MIALHSEHYVTAVEVHPWGTDVQFENGERGFLDNLKNPVWLTDESNMRPGEKILIVVLDESRDPVRVSALEKDMEIARTKR